VADAGYGESGELRLGLEGRGLAYVVQVKATTSAYPQAVAQEVAPYPGRGRRPRARYRAKRSSLAKLTQTGDDDRRPKEVKRATAELLTH
jgi:SRSO17 transposase